MMLGIYPLQPQIIDLSRDRLPAIVSIWQGNSLQLPLGGTHFGYVYQGQPLLTRKRYTDTYKLKSGMYFCLPDAGEIAAQDSCGIVITHLSYQGMFSLGGPIEPTGRFAYINGGRNSLLIPPIMRGDPCLNAMYFPPNVDQTLHTHPSYRIGMVVSGRAEIESQEAAIALEPGMSFLIPANTLHKFRTAESDFTVVVFHPDSDTGFTHRENPMLKRTLVDGISAAELPQIQTPM